MQTLLVSLSAKHIHKSLAPWCLKAYCEAQTPALPVAILECTINELFEDILAQIVAYQPQICGFSCYIWNIELVSKLSHSLSILLPHCKQVLGGPEVSFEAPSWGDYCIQGSGEHAFYTLCQAIDKGESMPHLLRGTPLSLEQLPTPYTTAYFDSFAQGMMRHIQNQLLYVETSRGCPFACSYCLSSASKEALDTLSMPRVEVLLQQMVSAGASCIKFVDRTCNAQPARFLSLLEFVASLDTDCTFHFEVAPDLFMQDQLALIATLPAGRVQFEIGIQSLHDTTLRAIHRATDLSKSLTTIQTLTALGNAHVHVDLIAGLPDETLTTFKTGFNAILTTKPQMLQLGFLKLLKGTALRADAARWDIQCHQHPPYQVIHTSTMSYSDLRTLAAVEIIVDKFYNSGAFAHTLTLALSVFPDAFTLFETLSKVTELRAKLSMKRAYTALLDCLLRYLPYPEISHAITLDCLSHDPKGQLPDAIPHHRDKQAEATARHQFPQCRVEYFPLDGVRRLFNYAKKHPVSASYQVIVLDNDATLLPKIEQPSHL